MASPDGINGGRALAAYAQTGADDSDAAWPDVLSLLCQLFEKVINSRVRGHKGSPVRQNVAALEESASDGTKSLLSVVLSDLRAQFPDRPPQTVQRIAELALHPTEHYRRADKYVRALQRCTNVTSSSLDFPMAPAEGSESEDGLVTMEMDDSVYGRIYPI